MRLTAVLDHPVTSTYHLEKPRVAPKHKNWDGVILKKTRCSLKPTLTKVQKLNRWMYCLEQINSATIWTRTGIKFNGLYDRVYVDEKWFWLCKDGEKYLLVDGEEEAPVRRVRHKKYMNKVMFLCAQARP
jgi:hypothetical protein